MIMILNDLKGLERSAPEYIDLSLFLGHLAVVAIPLVNNYNFEITAPYKKAISIITRSNLNLELYIDEPEEIMAILKKENE
jgi:hypothetical protein